LHNPAFADGSPGVVIDMTKYSNAIGRERPQKLPLTLQPLLAPRLLRRLLMNQQPVLASHMRQFSG
jgi:hypothetical protein